METAAYTKRGYHEYAQEGHDAEFEGVITGYGAVNGALVFAFAQDETRMKGAMDGRHAKKILDLYDLALKKCAPVVGIFSSCGAFVEEGVTALAAYGRLLKVVADAGECLTQVAYINGPCTGTSSAIAASFDFVVAKEGVPFYVTSPDLGGKALGSDTVCYTGSEADCFGYIRSLLAFLPEEDECEDCQDDLNRRLSGVSADGEIGALVAAISDCGVTLPYFPAFGDGLLTAFATVGGVKCGIVANNYAVDGGAITTEVACKLTSFLSVCDDYGLPVVTLVNSRGPAADISVDAVKALAYAYATLEVPQVTVILGHAIGAAFTLMGSKSLGAELVYTLEGAEIGVLPASSAVAFAWNGSITEETTREELEEKWRTSVSTPAAAAATGEIDDIIAPSEIRARIASALLMLSC